MDFRGKTALVTGSGSGIGRAIAVLLAQKGADIVVNDVSLAQAESTSKEVRGLDRKALICLANVADKKAVDEMFSQVKSNFGKIDILVNNAGITRDNVLSKMSDDEWDQVIDINVKGVFNCCRCASEMMTEASSGKIVNIASVAGQVGNIGQVNYSASKGAVISMTKTMAKELAPYRINVNAVSPGFIKTPMTDAVPEKIKAYLVKQIPLGRVGTPQDIANAVAFLSSDLSDYITGQVLNCNGGLFV